MTARLVLFEDSRWPDLSPLADVTPVPALRFGASTLGERWCDAAGVPLQACEARAALGEVWARIEPAAPAPDPATPVLAVNAAALPGAWFEAARAGAGPERLTAGGRIAAVRTSFGEIAPGLGRGAGFEAFLAALALPERAVEAAFLAWPWDLLARNAGALAADLAGGGGRLEGSVDPRAVVYHSERILVERGARVDALAVLDARDGPIRLRAGAVILPHSVVIGPCAIGEGTQLLGGFVGRSSIGPGCRLAGEVEECVVQGWVNKRHHGFVGHSVIGAWVNLGALTTTSDLKNNYGEVRAWAAGEVRATGQTKLGAFLGAHVKTGIGTLLPTGASVGAGSNLFGGGVFAPKRLPPFAWWNGGRPEEHRLEAMLATARTAAGRRGLALPPGEERLLREHFAATAGERAG